MTAITTEACEAAMDKARAQDNPDGAAAIKAQSFVCKRRGCEVSPAQCSDCFEAMSYTERFKYHENRQDCIKENKLKPKAAKGKIVEKKPLPPARELKSLDPDKPIVPSAQPVTGPMNVGDTVEFTDVNGQAAPIYVQITQELMDDYEAAMQYATTSAHDKMRGELLLNVAIAFYAGDSGLSINEMLKRSELSPPGGEIATSDANARSDKNGRASDSPHWPWAIDGFSTFEIAVKAVFGLAKSAAHYRCDIGKALLAHYGKENVIEQAEKMGIARIPQYKLRELIRAPRFFEELCTHGKAMLPSGEEVTIATILEAGIQELPVFLAQLTAPKTHHALEKKTPRESLEEWKKNDPFKNVPLSKKTEQIAMDFYLLRLKLMEVRDEFIQHIKGWPNDAPDIIGLDPELQKEHGKVEGILCALSAAFVECPRDPDFAQRLAYNEEGRGEDVLFLLHRLKAEHRLGPEPEYEQEPDSGS